MDVIWRQNVIHRCFSLVLILTTLVIIMYDQRPMSTAIGRILQYRNVRPGLGLGALSVSDTNVA